MENKNSNLDLYSFVEERLEATNIDLLPILDYLFGVTDVSDLRKELMGLYCDLSEYILWKIEEEKDYPRGLSWPLALIRQFCDALAKAESNAPPVTIKRLKP